METEKISNYLIEQQQQLEQRINAIDLDFKKGRSQDFAEQTSESENDEVLKRIQEEAKVELRQVNVALKRIKDGVYGVCSTCEEPINPERLTALPFANTCIHCAE